MEAERIKCPVCGDRFESGAAGTYVGERSGREYCSEDCAHEFDDVVMDNE